MTWSGHLWTIAPRLLSRLAAGTPPAARAWRLPVADPVMGTVELAGRLTAPEGARRAVLVVHGLGGCGDSPYAVQAAAGAAALGWACLRLHLRGSDLAGEDIYHAGLSADLHAALASPELAGYETLYLLGYSLGGHLALKAATEDELDPRVAAVAAVCAPLALEPGARHLDSWPVWPYRRYLLGGLKRIYRQVVARAERDGRPLPLPFEAARRIGTIVEWDERIVAPRFGFAGASEYYRRASVAPRLEGLRRPALLVAAPGDPMVPLPAVEAVLAGRDLPLLTVRREPGGHVGFPATLDLGAPAPPGSACGAPGSRRRN